MLIKSFDDRRNIAIAGSTEATIQFAAQHWIETAKHAIAHRKRFSVALSGGSTPHAIYQALSRPPYAQQLDWSKVYLFWSDERAVPPNHPDSNYHMAMESGLSHLSIPHSQIFRMQAEEDLEKKAYEYETLIRSILGPELFDLVMLGVGEDGHTASLFPRTTALEIQNRYVAPNWIPEKKTWRMTLTFPCIQVSRLATIYALGSSKQSIIRDVFKTPSYPASRIGTPQRKSLWILDKAAAQLLIK